MEAHRLSPRAGRTWLFILFIFCIFPRVEAAEKLVFNWPSEFRAKVSFENTHITNRGERSERHDEQGSFVLRSSRGKDHFIVDIPEVSLDQVSPSRFQNDLSALEKATNKLVRELPRYRIGLQGRFLGLDRREDYQVRAGRHVEEMLLNFPEHLRAGLREVMLQVLSPQHIEAGILNEWNNRVGFWIGRGYKQDQKRELIREVNIPALGDNFIAVRSEYRMLGNAVCERGGRQRSCVVLQLDSVPLEDDFREIEQAILGTTGLLSELRVRASVKLVTEPDTLLTHRFESVVRMGFYDDKSQVIEKVQLRSNQYFYE